jgi:uncharacterized protein
LTQPGPLSTQSAAAELSEILLSSDRLVEILRAGRACNPPNWLLVGGAIRTVVWDHLHGYEEPTAFRDVDLGYFDAADIRRESQDRIEGELRALLPEIPWQATNHAAVHLWYGQRFGYDVPPLRSIDEAVACMPDTTTCVGVRLTESDELAVTAPFGVADLMSMVVRWNPARTTAELYDRRVREKGLAQRWPGVTILGAES